jgi:NAD(P)-dependent dehydrogenase (short-subunit alcohol dehydrogenase family)
MDTLARMQVDLDGYRFRLIGDAGPVLTAVQTALVGNGAHAAAGPVNLLIVSTPLLPEGAPFDAGATMTAVAEAGEAMVAQGSGRIVFLLSALAGLPMRRHVEYSAAMAGAVARMRGLAMRLAPKVLVNAVGAGVIEDAGGAVLAGDPRMLSHASLGRAGAIEDVTNAVLFLCDPLNSYTTGQLLTVDGGWSVGYGRNF